MFCEIDNRKIGAGFPCYIVAELSGNHGGSIDSALKLIQDAKEAGADAVKLQTYTADSITLNSQKDDFKIPGGNPWSENQYLYNLYEKAQTPFEWHAELFRYAREIGITLFSSPFDPAAVELLESLGTPAYKIASPEITDIPLIKLIASKGKPVILSTGMSEKQDIELAVETIRKQNNNQIILLKCTSSYPAKPEDMNLLTIPDLSKTFDCLAGLSDHSMGIVSPVAAVSLGACFIEKHFIADKTTETVDSFFSLDKKEFSEMVAAVRIAEKSLGKSTYVPTEGVAGNLWARRSLYFCRPVKKGTFVTKEDIRSVRPAHGLHPKHFDEVIGKTVVQDVEAGERVSWSILS